MKPSKRTAVFPGSFDPVTRGHLDVIARAAEIFDRLIVAVLVNSEKRPLLGEDERAALIAGEVRRLPGVEVRTFRGLVVHLAAETGARWIVRGVRSPDDLTFELPMAHSNRLCGRRRIETVFLPTRPELAFISSKLVREIAARGGNLEPFVTAAVARRLAALHPDASRGRGRRR